MFTILDAAKNMKSSMTNDFSIYKRYAPSRLILSCFSSLLRQ